MNFSRQAQLSVGMLVVLSCMLLFFILSFGVEKIRVFGERQFYVVAKFDEVSGLYPKAPVRIAGVNIGTVTDISLEPETYRAVVHMQLDRSVAIPVDSIVKIYTEGILGSKYLAVLPGYDEVMIQDGGTFAQTESAVILEGLIAQLVNAFAGAKNA